MEGVGIEKIVKKLQLKKYIEDMELKGHRIKLADVNRPALQLSGYFEHFEQSRVQIIGMVEYTYLQHLNDSENISNKGDNKAVLVQIKENEPRTA